MKLRAPSSVQCPMTYRGDADPLKAKETALASELSSLRRRERDVTRALDDTRAELRRERTLPVLEDVRIASPCSASWDEMTGDARVRFCGKCAKNVYNLSEMSREEAQALLASTEGGMCVRLYKRQDGTVLTADCPVGVRKKRVRRVMAATFGAGIVTAGAALTLASFATMGERAPTMGAVVQSPETQPVMKMGEIAPTETAAANPPAPPAPTVHVVQGAAPPRRNVK